MTREQRTVIIKMVKEYVKLGADVNALKSILASEKIAQHITPDWEADFRRLQNSPEYQQVIEVNEPMIARLEQAMTENDLIELLAQRPPEGPPN